MNDLTLASASELAQAIRDRRVSAVEVLDAYLAQIAKHNSKLNAICTLDEKNARFQANRADEALVRGENWGKYVLVFKTDQLFYIYQYVFLKIADTY